MVALIVLTLIAMGFPLATEDIPFLAEIAFAGLVARPLPMLVGLGALLWFAVNLRREKVSGHDVIP